MLTFLNEPAPNLPISFDATGNLVFLAAEDFIWPNFAEDHVQVWIIPPPGWSLTSVTWPRGISNGWLPIVHPVTEANYPFTFKIKQGAQTKNGSGAIAIKPGTGDPPGPPP